MMLSKYHTTQITRLLIPLLVLLAILTTGGGAAAAPAKSAQKSFASPEGAAAALVSAIKADDSKELQAIMGPGSREILSSGDPVDDRAGRERFAKLYEEKLVVERPSDGKALLSLGNEGYPFAIPLTKRGAKWAFDVKAGRTELLNRRIGRNELEVIEVLHAYVDAQRDYASRDRDGSGSGVFAQRIRSTPGKRDGLYWEAKEGEEESPLGPLAAQAAREGYGTTKAVAAAPFHGYYFKILTGQGKDAEGGAFDYVVNGKMLLGFAMLAYPAKYGSSGVMTFMVNQSGVVYQKDLGKSTGKTAGAIKLYNPGKGWRKVELKEAGPQ